MRLAFPTILFSLILLQVSKALAQVKPPGNKIITDLLERFIENSEATVDYTDLQEQLEYYMENKLDLNKASGEDLGKLVFLNDILIKAILHHRAKFGDFMSVYELQTINALDDQTLDYLRYFISVDFDWKSDQTKLKDMLSKGKSEVLTLYETEFQQREGYSTQRKETGRLYYEGDPYRLAFRYRFNYTNRLSFGYSGEKDMGEPFFSSSQKYGFDFNSFHFFYKPNNRYLQAIALGDYQANFGQGLTFGSGIATYKSAYVLNIRRNYLALRPYRSLNENEFLRGAALTARFKEVELTTFLSSKYISTNYKNGDSLSAQDAFFSSIQYTGLHRTSTEIANRDNVLQTIYGGHASWKTNHTEIGITTAHTQYDQFFQPGNAPYQLYNFRGNKLSNYGIDYRVQIQNIGLFGELSYSSNRAWAGIAGMTVPLDAKLDVVVLYRNFARDYQTTFANAFAENSDNRNEEGIYTGINFKLNRKWQWNMYADMYHSHWLRYMTDAPSRGVDVLSEWQYNPSRSLQIYGRYRYETKLKNQPGNETPMDYLVDTDRGTIRLHAQYVINKTWNGKTRFEYAQYFDPLQKHQQGTLVYQDITYVTPLRKLSLNGRVTLFSIDSYNARIYAVESDVLYQYSVPVYQYSGIHYTFLVNYSFTKKLEVWIKYSQTTYNNRNVISSGLDHIQGNTQSEIRIQLRWMF